MKRAGNLWEEIISFQNIIDAANWAQKSKRFRYDVLLFNDHLEEQLIQIQKELINQTYQPGPYKTFAITDPKPRIISAAPYRDRVVHHVLCNIITYILDRSFIYDSYANRYEKGTHRALKRMTKFVRSSKYILQYDIKKYFPTINHIILKRLIREKIKCPQTLWLIDKIIDHSRPETEFINEFPDDELLTSEEKRAGLPIGNLTSQLFANVYLNGFDHFIKEELKVKKYIRYMDDFALFSDDIAESKDHQELIESYLSSLRLVSHPVKTALFGTAQGVNFVGFRILSTCIRIKSDAVSRIRTKIANLKKNATESQILKSLEGIKAHLSHSDSWRLMKKIEANFDFLSDPRIN